MRGIVCFAQLLTLHASVRAATSCAAAAGVLALRTIRRQSLPGPPAAGLMAIAEVANRPMDMRSQDGPTHQRAGMPVSTQVFFIF